MLVDYHIHLEEGPYSIQWAQKILENYYQLEGKPEHTLDQFRKVYALSAQRIAEGAYSMEWLKRYVDTGLERGIEEFGFVDHLYRFRENRSYYDAILQDDTWLGKRQQTWLHHVCVESMEKFIEFIEDAKALGLPVKLGIEADYFPGKEEELDQILQPYDWDFIIGSVHFIDGWGFDNPETKHIYQEKEMNELYARFFYIIQGAVKSKLFDIIGHADNLKVFGHRMSEDIELLYRETASVIKKHDICVEINTGLAYRYPVKEMCPSVPYLKVLKEFDIPITLSSDAHFPTDVGTMVEEAAKLAMQLGFTNICRFSRRKRTHIELRE